MRIGLIAGPWYPIPPAGYGGIELVVDALAKGFSRAGHEVLLAAAADSTCPVERLPGMHSSEPDLVGFTSSELSHVISAYAGMDGMVDLVHDHTLAGPLYRGRPDGLPVVTTIHSDLSPSFAAVYGAAARDTTLIAISKSQVSSVLADRVAAIIPHGMEVDAVPVGHGQGGYACFLGRMCPDKGVVEAIRVAQLAGVPLRIAAKMREPAELQYYRDVVKPLQGPDVEFLGEVGGAEKYKLLGEATALLNPIQWMEPFGLVMIEAMATGTPVVATPMGSAPEIVDDGVSGYLASSLEDLAGLLLRAGTLDRRAVRAQAEDRFSTERMVEAHLALYSRLTGVASTR
ncbi:putative glycosyltransferase [Arthrobacter globiformis NBRC 12137]|uniref:Putative glycosyltransferase n=1 Tax=Arthrobacter globiformis (strain ATCC 8010 / DSM 20124 / JCM 1332 / NBRC 12137 / NCIMB 8907 / NRRL B-2979 / 168) TaxID=1077972 RepID=H0QS85_ARTG1|nr:glycosyltransferase family 4 protein [Arthrobacter globiformis]GAB15686.1 putative glycosyltransferase [Arthrobacter globiformis NBRC 12137]